mgnify:CR=1 FL=1
MNYEKGERNVKIEISKRSFGNKYELKNYLGIPIQVMVRQDMAANKFAALLGRRTLANRDIFDVWFMLKNRWDINFELLEERTGLKTNDYLKKCIDFLEKGLDVNILDGLGELLDNKTKVWVKEKLVEDTMFLLNVRLQGMREAR